MGFVAHATEVVNNAANDVGKAVNDIGDALAPIAIPAAIAAAIYFSGGLAAGAAELGMTTEELIAAAVNSGVPESEISSILAADAAASTATDVGLAALDEAVATNGIATAAMDTAAETIPEFVAPAAETVAAPVAAAEGTLPLEAPLAEPVPTPVNAPAPVTPVEAGTLPAEAPLSEPVPMDVNSPGPVTPVEATTPAPLPPQPNVPITPSVPGVTPRVSTGGGTTPTGGPTPSTGGSLPQLAAVLATLYSGNKTADAINAASDKLQQGITTAQGQLLTSKTDAINALNNGLISQTQAYNAGLTDANGALIQNTQQALETSRFGGEAAWQDLATQLDPYTFAGQQAIERLSAGMAPGGEFSGTFTMADAQNSPAMKFAQEQGMNTIQNSAAAKGGLLGTNALADLTQFGQANAAQYEKQAFDQWLANRNANVTGIQNLATQGQNAATTLGQGLATIDQNTANTLSALQSGLGTKLAGNFMTTGANVGNAAGQNAANVANVQTSFGKNLADTTQTGATANANSIMGGANNISNTIDSAIKAYTALGGGTLPATAPTASGVANTAGNAVNTAINTGVNTAVNSGINTLTNAVKDIWGNIVG